jgi:internalin A
MSELALQLIREAKEKQSRELDLSYKQLTDISALIELTHLEELNLSGNQLTDISALIELTHLEELNLSSNQLTDISALKKLNRLFKLDLSYNQLTDICALKELTELRQLYLSNNQFTDISALKRLTYLYKLNLSGNWPTNISALKELTRLTHLYLSNNQLTEISALKKLTHLLRLDLSNNQLTDISALKELTLLLQLDLSNNQLSDINALKELTHLRQLELRYNQLTDITPIKHLLQKDIPFKWENDYSLSGVILEGNPLNTPPREIIKQGNGAIWRYFNQELETKYEAKILIVGEPEAGKTSLMKKITDPTYVIPVNEDSTIGIQVIKWSCPFDTLSESVQLNVWDFGGQEMQYLTHQFFLTPDALYILLTSARKDYDNLDYWFNIISLLGKNENNENSKLLVVANEIKMQEGQVSKSFDNKKYQDLYTHLPFQFYTVNLATEFDREKRFAVLLHAIKKSILELPVLGKPLPVKWGITRKRLQGLKRNYLYIQEYLDVCKSADIDEKLAIDLSSYLHKIGEVLHFKADNYIILNPKWAMDGIYSILKRKEIEENDGHFTEKQVYDIWEGLNYTLPERNLFLSLMSKDSFEVAYKIPNKKDEYIAPQLLSLTQPDYDWDKAGALQFRYFYPFMPKGILTRLIVRMHEAIKYKDGKGLVWRTGVFFERNSCTAKVEETKIVATGQQVITIEVQGYKPNRKLLLYDICRTIEGIHKDSFARINFERQIPCNCDHCKTLTQPAFYDYSELLEYLNEGIPIRCKLKVKNELSIRTILQDIFDVDFTALTDNSREYNKEKRNEALTNDPFSVTNTRQKKKNIFVSYSQKDTRFILTNGVVINFKEELENQLKSLRRLGLAEVWSDTNLLTGADWDTEIKKALADADIILFLVSANLIGTDYVWNKELPLAKYHQENKETVLIPVILNYCQWEDIPLFSENNAVPNKGKPVAAYNNREEAYNEITNKIRIVIEQ